MANGKTDHYSDGGGGDNMLYSKYTTIILNEDWRLIILYSRYIASKHFGGFTEFAQKDALLSTEEQYTACDMGTGQKVRRKRSASLPVMLVEKMDRLSYGIPADLKTNFFPDTSIKAKNQSSMLNDLYRKLAGWSDIAQSPV